jgi:ABC-type transport system involved in multi-copper enzyme maturation permease subunit
MLWRISAVMFNTYREAVRARVLHGLFAIALATVGYSVIVGQFALRSSFRVVSDLGAASISLGGVIVAVVLAASSLYRELELKTIFPILARPLRRSEYLVGKYLGTVLTMAVFIGVNAGAALVALGGMGDASWVYLGSVLGGGVVACVVAAWRLPRFRTHVPMALAVLALIVGWSSSGGAIDDRRVVLGSALLSLCEVGIVTAVAMLFASFSSPFLTATFTLGLFVVGRSADTLAHLPNRVFGEAIAGFGAALSKVVPNLMLYVPPRQLLTGEAPDVTLGAYLPVAALHAAAWSVGLLAAAALVFRRRDFH